MLVLVGFSAVGGAAVAAGSEEVAIHALGVCLTDGGLFGVEDDDW